MFSDPDNSGGQFKNYIKRRMTLQWGGLSDGFDWYEKKFGTSLELLRFFREIDYPVSISTKGVWWVDDPRYQEIVRDAKHQHWKYSIITSNEEHVLAIEPGVPPARERFEAMRKLNDLGVGATTLRFRPFVLGTSDLCIEEMMKMAKDSGCYSVTTEFLTWESRASNTSRARLDVMSKVLGYDVWEFYTKNSARASGLLRLNYDLKRPYMKKMKEAAESYGLKFFVSDAHHKEDSYNAGCCGLPESGPLSNINRGQYAHAIKLAKDNGFVKWSDIKEDAFSLLSEIAVIEAEGFPSDTAERAKRHYQSMYDYMHDIWNNPKSWQSPARYFGGALVPSAPDENGDVIYLYNKPFIEEGLRVNSVNELAIKLNMIGKPNADRFDDMVKDGGDFGHIAYPVVVFSRGRADIATTPALLDKARIQNWVMVVPANEAAQYTLKFPEADILLLPDGVEGIGAAREYIYQRYREEGYPYVWMLDDDLVGFHKLEGGKRISCSPRALFSGLEKFAEYYTNIALLGVDSEGENNEKFAVNRWHDMRGLYLVNIQSQWSFDPKLTLCEIEDFALKNLATGQFSTVMHKGYSIEIMQAAYGGCTSAYISGARSSIAEAMAERYPEYFYIAKTKAPMYYDFEPIPGAIANALVPRALQELTGG